MKANKNSYLRSVRNDQRRDFIKRVSGLGLSVPATALLLSVTQKRANADTNGYGNSSSENWESGSKGGDGQPDQLRGFVETKSDEPPRFYINNSGRGEREVLFGTRKPDAGGKGGPGG